MSHALRDGQAPDQASSGRQTGAAVPLGQIIPKARNAASHLTSHKQHGDTNLATAPDRPTRRVSQFPYDGELDSAPSLVRSWRNLSYFHAIGVLPDAVADEGSS